MERMIPYGISILIKSSYDLICWNWIYFLLKS